jgi:hypothetical protein
MYAPHTVTVYNAHENVDTLKSEYNVTVLEGVFLDVSKGANVMRSGLANADAAKLFVPFSVRAVNGLTGQEQTYIDPKEYERLSDKSPYWTFRSEGTSSNKDCFFVKGRVVADMDFQELNAYYDNVFRVSSVDLRDFGGVSMRHWEVSGK